MASTLPRLCSECGKQLIDKERSARTCGDRCRGARSRRLKAQYKKENETPEAASPTLKDMNLAVRSELDDMVHKTMKEHLGPIVREAITEDVMRAIQALLGAAPTAVAALMQDLEQTDSYDRRQRAYTLLMKYTVGNSPLVPSVDPTPPAVNIIIPGLDDVSDQIDVPEADVVEDDEFQCSGCDEIKHVSEAAAYGADRCKDCHANLQARRDDLLRSSAKSS